MSGESGETGGHDGPERDRKVEVAVLGGGAAGITAAYELSKDEKLREAFSVTVYTNGWRLGGKGASGRASDSPDGPHRVQEHGLHVWFGFYKNAFAMMGECYGAGVTGIPFTSVGQAFEPIDQLVLTEAGDGDYQGAEPARCLEPPTHGVSPGAFDEPDDWREFFTVLLARILDLVEAVRGEPALIVANVGDQLIAVDAEVASAAQVARRQNDASEPNEQDYLDFADRLEAGSVEIEGLVSSASVRRLREVLGLGAVGVRILADRLLAPLRSGDPHPFDRLNELELRDLMRAFGASDELLESAPVRSLYDLAFSYRDGDPARPDVAAGVALENVLSILFRHDGVMMRKMNGGMGDVVFAPLYTLLRDRDVRFEFFSAVTDVEARPTEDGGAEVVSVRLQRQAKLGRSATPYEPLHQYDILGWPAEPDPAQLDQSSRDGLERLRKTAPGVPGAAGHAHWALEREPDPLGLGDPFELQSEDLDEPGYFDQVVLAIPIGAHEQVAKGLLDAHRGLRAMLEQAEPVCTQAFQLWLEPDRQALGWPCPDAEHPLLGAYAKPFDTYLDMSHAIRGEQWPAGSSPGSLSFFCGVLPDPSPKWGRRWGVQDWHAAHLETKLNVEQFIADHVRRAPPPFWQNLDLAAHVGSIERHYWRANSTPWERYATSHAGRMDRRLRPDGTCPGGGRAGRFANLALAGDWTYTPINAGAVESAVMSGIEAAASLIGRLEGTGIDPPEVEKAPWRR